MKVVILGGAGHMGRHAVAALLDLPWVEHLVVADRDGDALRSLTQTVDGQRINSARVDVNDTIGLAAVLEDRDVVISAVGPYFRFGTTVLDAALESGCHYLDICDDPIPTLELLERDPVAQDAGLTAIVGAGASPGVSNLLAVQAIDGLTEIDLLLTGWGTGGRDAGSQQHPDGATAAVEHWVQQLTGIIPIHDDGHATQAQPLQPVPVRLPGRGSVTAYTVGHPEPVTLPRSFPAIQRSVNVMDMPAAVMSLLRDTVDAVNGGRLSIADASRELSGALYAGGTGPGGVRGAVRALAAAAQERIRGKKYLPELFALAIGSQHGRQETRAVYLNGTIAGGMGPLTCTPTVVMLAMLAEGQITRRGVFAPEAGVSPRDFFDRLDPYLRHDRPGQGPICVETEI